MSLNYPEYKIIEGTVLLVVIGAINLFVKLRNHVDDELPSSTQRSSSSELNSSTTSYEPAITTVYKQYSRKAVWLRHVMLFVVFILSTFQMFNMSTTLAAPISITFLAWLLKIVSLVFLVYLDDVTALGTSFQRKFLYVYLLLSLSSGIEFAWQKDSASLSIFLCHIVALGASLYAAFFNPYSLYASAPTPEYTSNLLSYISFFYLNAILISPNLKKDAMELEDVPHLHEDDCTESVYAKFQRILSQQHKLDLTSALFTLIWPVWIEQAFFQWLSCTSNFIAPLALEKILIFVHCEGDLSCYNSRGFLSVSPYMAALIMLFVPLLKCASDGQNYVRGRHVGVRLRAALIGSIFNKSMSVDLSASQESVGKLNNLISVDVGEIQNFFCYSNFLWSTLYEIVIAITLLCLVLGEAAVAGIVTMLVFMITGFYLGAKLEGYQSKLLATKDKRIAITNEVLNSVRIIKYYAWEGKFIDKINAVRIEELIVQLVCSFTQATLFVVWEIVPSIVSMVAFLTYTQILGRTMSPSLGFTALTLFNALRFPLSQFPDIITMFITSRASLKRIHEYFVADDTPGLPGLPPQVASKGSIVIKNLTVAWRRVQHDDAVSASKGGKKMQCCQYVYQATIGKIGSLCNFGRRSGDSAGSYPAPLNSTRTDTMYSKLPEEDDTTDVESPLSTLVSSDRSNQRLDDIHVVLRDVNMNILPGGLNVIIGTTGAGKSSLLSAILGETLLLSGERFMTGEVAYSTQTAWIQNATLRDNILFGSPFDPTRYARVIKACALEEDLKALPRGDLTEIGEKGINLSGGQKQRVSLARAAYVKNDIIILDDPLSAVDAHVGEHIFRELILGFLRDRTVLLVTHHLPMALAAADYVLYLDAEQQTVRFQCSPQELYNALKPLLAAPALDKSTVSFLWVVYNELAQIYDTSSGRTIDSSSFPGPSEVKREQSVEDMLEEKDGTDLTTNPLNENLGQKNLSEVKQEAAAEDEVKRKATTSHIIVVRETKNTGEITWKTYWFFFKALGGVLPVVVVFLVSLAMTSFWFLQSYTLGLWMQSMTTRHSLHNIMLTYYLLCALALVLSYVSRAAAQTIYRFRASEQIHANLIKSILLAPCGWFDATPLGRIINRFSQDISTVDNSLLYNLLSFLDCLIGVVQVFLVIVLFLPPLIAFLLPVLGMSAYVTYQYMHVSRELKRLESLMKSPVFVLFSEAMNGLSVLRAFANQPLRFRNKLSTLINNMNACHFYTWAANRWLNFRMQGLGALVSGVVAVGIVYTTQSHSAYALSSTSAGLALIYSLGFCNDLTHTVRSHADVQMDLNSVERLEEYSTIVSEKYNPPPKTMDNNTALRQVFSVYVHPRILDLLFPVERTVNCNDSTDDPEVVGRGVEMRARTRESSSELHSKTVFPPGHLIFRDVFLRYPSSPSPVLKGVSFDLPGGKRLGVVGRTGAGKSSLITALFRLVELEEGQIMLDGQDIATLPLLALRETIGIVPQEPSLFRGTLRSNLDPFSQHSDQEIWQALRIARLEAHIRCLGQQQEKSIFIPLEVTGEDVLDLVQVAEKGSNFSQGQRQLLCLARALLHSPSLLILDECTASVDAQTDALIQEAVRYGLPNSTVMCIAHRLQTVVYYDMILFLDAGEVREVGCPHALLQDESSAFFQLCQSSGMLEELKEIAALAARERQGSK